MRKSWLIERTRPGRREETSSRREILEGVGGGDFKAGGYLLATRKT